MTLVPKEHLYSDYHEYQTDDTFRILRYELEQITIDIKNLNFEYLTEYMMEGEYEEKTRQLELRSSVVKTLLNDYHTFQEKKKRCVDL